MYDLSIVIPTCNRAEQLGKSLALLSSAVRRSFEVIVVDGASTDATPTILATAARQWGDRLKIIREPRREGFTRAANKGFRAASGRLMTWLNDDARPVNGALDRAADLLDAAADDVAFVAMFHRWHSPKNIAFEAEHGGQLYQLCHVRGTLYANFAMGYRSTYENLGYFDERFFFYGCDPDLSLKAWDAGMRVIPGVGCFIEHDEFEDDRREQDNPAGRADNEKLFAKWNLPPRNLERNDFNPFRPCTVNGLRDAIAAAA